MNHPLFTQPFGSLLDAMLAPPAAALRPLAINAWETEEAYLLEAELPGLTLDAVDVVVHDDLVTLKVGETTDDAPSTDDERRVLRRERKPIRGSRSLRLSTPVDADATTAVLKDGVLTVRLPKAAEHRPRTIAITDGDA